MLSSYDWEIFFPLHKDVLLNRDEEENEYIEEDELKLISDLGTEWCDSPKRIVKLKK